MREEGAGVLLHAFDPIRSASSGSSSSLATATTRRRFRHVPYSEGIGFIAHATAEDDLDMPFYVTLHELAHQWWAHQVVGSLTQGSSLMSETLAQYSALM